MAKAAYLGVDGTARKIKKSYVGVGGTARKIRRAYLGVGGVARPCWSGAELVAYGSIASLRGATAGMIPSNSRYLIFGQGGGCWSETNVTTAYNSDLVRSAPSDRSHSKFGVLIGANENYSVMGGGITDYSCTNQVDAYSTTLTRSNPSGLSQARGRGCGAKFMEYAVLAGGGNSSSSTATAYTNVDLYDLQLSRSTVYMSIKREDASIATVRDRWLLCSGGWANGVSDMKVLDAFDADLTRTTISMAKSIGSPMAAGCVGKYGIFTEAAPIAYDQDLTALELSNISAYGATGYYSGGAELEGFFVFGGTSTKNLCVCDDILTLTVLSNALRTARNYGLAGGSIGNFGIFAGGTANNSNTLEADAVTVI